MSKKQLPKHFISKAKELGDFVLYPYRFENISSLFKVFKTPEYKRLNHKQKSEKVNRILLEQIEKGPESCFLLIAVIEFIDKVARENILINYTFASFELWLNQLSRLSEEENYKVRAKIVGKWIPRDAYQILFPVGMGKIHSGSHFVTAHSSPDLDTTIASFWGWVDAFGARVSEGIHLWNLPGGGPQSSIEIALLFHHIFGQNVFQFLAKTRESLALSSLELMTQKGVLQQHTDQSSIAIEHERSNKAVILVDKSGYYLGDWRSFDVEGVRQVTILLNNCLRWFENYLHIHLISLFAKKNLHKKDLVRFEKEVFGIQLKECDPVKECTEKQQHYVDGYLRKVFKVEKGLQATFAQLAKSMHTTLSLFGFQKGMEYLKELTHSDLFDAKGNLIEDRPGIFHHLEKMIAEFDLAIQSICMYTERLDVALSIKTQIFGYLPQVISYRADVEELRSKMGNYSYLTVTSSDEEGKMLPLGVVRARDLQQPILGTVTVRDFCNREETKIPSYFEVISAIDHHKAALQTTASSVVYLSDAQSSNTIVAELAFTMNDAYSTNGVSKTQIQAQIQKVQKDLENPSHRRILKQLLNRLHAVEEEKKGYFIDPLREFIEYLHFLYAILDDTDLLTKVSARDVEIVACLLNRLKSLMEGKEVEIITLDDLKRGKTFAHEAATRILQHPDMFSLYRKIYLAKEQLIEENLELCTQGKESSIFADTKLQNGCVRVGQTKLFAKNFPSFVAHRKILRQIWTQQAQGFFEDHREYDLHLQMISTVAGAEDLYTGSSKQYSHKDELWMWIPMTEQAIQHLKDFLSEFSHTPQLYEKRQELEVELEGIFARELHKIFRESYLPTIYHVKEGKGASIAILYFPAGAVNSRKAMISPYLPEPVH